MPSLHQDRLGTNTGGKAALKKESGVFLQSLAARAHAAAAASDSSQPADPYAVALEVLVRNENQRCLLFCVENGAIFIRMMRDDDLLLPRQALDMRVRAAETQGVACVQTQLKDEGKSHLLYPHENYAGGDLEVIKEVRIKNA